jgi:hypothetical protein
MNQENFEYNRDELNFAAEDFEMTLENEVKLKDVLPAKIKYIYDYGDFWHHYLETEKIIEDYIERLNQSDTYVSPIVTEVKELDSFWKAEEYHQNYEQKNPNDSYVRNVSIPRLNRFKDKFPDLLKGSH